MFYCLCFPHVCLDFLNYHSVLLLGLWDYLPSRWGCWNGEEETEKCECCQAGSSVGSWLSCSWLLWQILNPFKNFIIHSEWEAFRLENEKSPSVMVQPQPSSRAPATEGSAWSALWRKGLTCSMSLQHSPDESLCHAADTRNTKYSKEEWHGSCLSACLFLTEMQLFEVSAKCMRGKN